MGSAIQLRSDYWADDLRRLARTSDDAAQARRLLALAMIYEGCSRGMAAKTGGVGLQIVRDWVLRFNENRPEGLHDRKAPGKTPLLNNKQRAALNRTAEAGPTPYLDGVVRWRLIDLVQWLREEFCSVGQPSDIGARIACDGLSQTFGPSTSLCAGRPSH